MNTNMPKLIIGSVNDGNQAANGIRCFLERVVNRNSEQFSYALW